MNTKVGQAGEASQTIRNSPLLTVTIFVASVAGFLVSPCLAILCLTTLIPLHGYTFGRVFWVLSYAVAAWFSGKAGINLWRLASGMVRHQARLETQGVYFLLVPERHAKPEEQFVAWNQIAAIRHRRMGDNQFYSVVTKDNRVLAFDTFAFFRPRKLALHISARAGVPIQELE
jgi:type IV secretory pathway TrbD component